MKMMKNISLTALLSFSLLGAVTFTSCNEDKCKDVVCANGTCNEDDGTCTCPTGYEGNLCQNEVRSNYAGSYKGSGTDNNNQTYTNFTLTYSKVGTNALDMQVAVANTAGANFLTLPIKLQTNTTYNIQSTTIGNFTYTGNGSISSGTATIVINQDGTGTNPDLVITFTNLVRI